MNPNGQPFQPFSEPPPSGNGQQDLNVPSILLMVIAGIGILLGLVGLVTPGGGSSEQLDTMLNDPNIPPAFKQSMGLLTNGAFSKGINAFSMLCNGLIIFGAMQMRNLKMYPLAMVTAILSMIPASAAAAASVCPSASGPSPFWFAQK